MTATASTTEICAWCHHEQPQVLSSSWTCEDCGKNNIKLVTGETIRDDKHFGAGCGTSLASCE